MNSISGKLNRMNFSQAAIFVTGLFDCRHCLGQTVELLSNIGNGEVIAWNELRDGHPCSPVRSAKVDGKSSHSINVESV